MTGGGDWVDSGQIAATGLLSDRKARRALERAERGLSYRGHQIAVRRVCCVGGNAGWKREAYVPSLPADLQARLNAAQRALESPSKPRDASAKAKENARWYYSIIEPIVSTRDPRERRAEIKKLISSRQIGPDGKTPVTIKETSLRRWVKKWDAGRIDGLTRRARSDKNARKVIISQRHDRIVGDHDKLRSILASLERFLAEHRHVSRVRLLVIVKLRLKELMAEAGVAIDAHPDDTWDIPRGFIDKMQRRWNVVTMHETRRKEFNANRPHARRDPTTLEPNQRWCIDVTPFDIVMRRPDGSRAHARGIGILDVGTNRLRFSYVLSDKGKGVRNAHMIRAFTDAAKDPNWGVPDEINIDHGRENRFADRLEDALALIRQVRGRNDRPIEAGVSRSRVRNPQGKPVESIFAAFNKFIRDVPGYVGGDRMNSHSDSVHRPARPFEGTLEEFQGVIDGRLLEWDIHKLRGNFAGRTPRQIFEQHKANGWRAYVLDPRELERVFYKDVPRVVRQGSVSWADESWLCDGLSIEYWNRRVVLRVPMYHDAPDALVVLDDRSRNVIAVATPQRRYVYGDPAGPKAAASLTKEAISQVRALQEDVPAANTVAEGLRLQSQIASLPPSPAAGVLSISDQYRAEAEAAAESPESNADKHKRKALARQRKELAKSEAFVKKLGATR